MMKPILPAALNQYRLNGSQRVAGAPLEDAASTPRAFDPFDRIIGQLLVVPFLREIRDGIRLGAHPHPLLFLGRPGYGKTSVAKAFAESIGAEFVRIDCGPELKSEHLVEQLMALKSLSVLFVDEFQAMKKRVQEVLYGAIDLQTVPKLDGHRLDRCAPPVTIAPFVLVGATNEPGRLLPAMRARMVNVVMEEYSEDDLRLIVRQKARRFLLSLSDKAVDLVVRASGGSPRNIVQILQSVECTSTSWRLGYHADEDLVSGGCSSDGMGGREQGRCVSGSLSPDLAVPPSLMGDPLGPPLENQQVDEFADEYRPLIPDELVERALTWMGLDKAGLDATSRTILATVNQHGRATADLVANVLGLDIAYARERLAELRARLLVSAAPGRGWVLTDLGSDLVAQLGI
jgi:Holliday junction resolvasome RuvABC ATP-dependent DNA helicase subunit